MSDLNMSHGKISNFDSFPLFALTLIIKLWNFDFESHWNTLMIFDKKRYDIRFEYVTWKYVWFCFIFIASIQFLQKTKKFQFWISLKYFNVLDYDVKFSAFCQLVSNLVIWLKLRCLKTVLALNWEIWILNFTEKVKIFQSSNCCHMKIVTVFFVLFVFFRLTIDIVSN